MPGRGRPFQPGNPVTPGGRPTVAAEGLELARQHGPEAIARLVALMRSDNEPVAIRAAEAILDRAYGRPPLAIAVEEQRPLQVIICDAPPNESSRIPTAPNRLPSPSSHTDVPMTVVFE